MNGDITVRGVVLGLAIGWLVQPWIFGAWLLWLERRKRRLHR